MSKWSNKYIGLKYKFGSHNLDEGTDCLRLVEEIFKREKNYHIEEDGEPVTEEWYIKNPERLIRQAVERGEVINDVSQLKEFDIVFFKTKNSVRHMGVMIDNYGRFLHQLSQRKSRADDLNARHWNKRFFCAVRIDWKK